MQKPRWTISLASHMRDASGGMYGQNVALTIYVCLSAGIQSSGELVPETLGSNPAFSRGRQLVSFRLKKMACLCQSIEINNNKHIYRHSQVGKPTGSEVEWAECSLIIGTGCWVQDLAWYSIAQSVCQRAFSLLAIWCLRSQVRILHSAEEDSWPPFYSKIAWLCKSIEINNNIHI